MQASHAALHTVPELLSLWKSMALHFLHEHILCFAISYEVFLHMISSQPPVKMITHNLSDRKDWKHNLKNYKGKASVCVCVYFICKWYPHMESRKGCLMFPCITISLPYSTEKGSLTELEPHCSGKAGWLASLGDPPVCISQCWDYRHMQPCPTFYVGTGVLNSSPHDCKASNLTKWAISPAPKDNFFFKSLIWLKIKLGSWYELKYLWEKILQRYLCLYFFIASCSPLWGNHTRT